MEGYTDVLAMGRCEDMPEGRQPAHGCVAVVDRRGILHGWTTAFAADLAYGTDKLGARRIHDFIPELDGARWEIIWRSLQLGCIERMSIGRPVPHGDETRLMEVELCPFMGDDGLLAKLEIRNDNAASAQLRLLQQEILEAMASGVPLPDIMDLLCRRAEALAPSVICSVLTVDKERRLQHLASPSLPPHYSTAVNGVQIGPKVGSCGTAAYRGEPVTVVDIAADPLWDDYRSLVLPLGLRACWSSPIKSGKGKVLGAFAFYYPVARGPLALEREIVATCLHLCAIALEHEQTQQRIQEMAFHDPLTGLANRSCLVQRVNEGLRIIAETGNPLAIQRIGLDDLQSINDSMGYSAGDEVLRIVASRLQKLVGGSDTVARIGDQEFVVLQAGDQKLQSVSALAGQIIESIEQPFVVQGQRLALGARIGIALAPDDGTTTDELLRNAALALRRVGELESGTYFFYERMLNARMQVRRRLESGLREALIADEFELAYQPIVSLKTDRIVRAEALLRWQRSCGTGVPPSDFIPIAEDLGIIAPLGAWVVEQACLAASKWPSDVDVAVNLSPVQFETPGLIKTVCDALAKSGLSPSRLQLEVTESVLLHDHSVNLSILDQLSELGVSIALDDFGTGYSSLSYLQRFAFDRIKIDRSFINNINENPYSLKIVRSIVMLAHSLGLTVTAEGVETDAQLATVRGEGCDDVQGFHLGRPVPLDVFRQQLLELYQVPRIAQAGS
jgi:diguanylate cyclase (GGDEF)-like protein